MPKDDQELVEIARNQLEKDGLNIREGVNISRLEKDGDGIAAILEADGGEEKIWFALARRHRA